MLLFSARRIWPHVSCWAGHINLDLLQLSCCPSLLLFKGDTCESALQACHIQLSHHCQDKKVPQATLPQAHLSYSVVLPLTASCPGLFLNLHSWAFSFFYDFLENVITGSTILLKLMYIYFPSWPIVFSSEQEFNIVQHPVCRNTFTTIFYLPPGVIQCPNATVLHCIHEMFIYR